MATDGREGIPTTFGAYAFQNATAPSDAFIVKKMRDAGLIILGKTNLAVHDSFSYASQIVMDQLIMQGKIGNGRLQVGDYLADSASLTECELICFPDMRD